MEDLKRIEQIIRFFEPVLRAANHRARELKIIYNYEEEGPFKKRTDDFVDEVLEEWSLKFVEFLEKEGCSNAG